LHPKHIQRFIPINLSTALSNICDIHIKQPVKLPMATTTKDVALEGPEQFHTWFLAIKGSVPRDLWKYFDPETEDEFDEPEPITLGTIRPGVTSITAFNTTERNQYTSLRTIYNHEVSQYQRFLSEEAKLRNKILNTVPESKKPQLRDDKTVRDWITNLKTSTKPTDAQMKDIVRARHRTLLGAKYVEWPTGGPEKWLSEWEKLMADCETWCPALYDDWASDFNLVWGEVSGAKRVCDRLVEAIAADEVDDDWDIYRASRELRQAWDQKAIRSGMKIASKGKVTRAAFAAEPRLDGMPPEASELPSTEQATPTASPQGRPNSRKRSATESTQKEGAKRTKRTNQKPCWGCGGLHPPFHCALITGQNPRDMQIPPECRTAFEKKMKDPSFAKKIGVIREANKFKRDLAAAADAED
jgi:hypothetical protein